jgi:hypothetical protein
MIATTFDNYQPAHGLMMARREVIALDRSRETFERTEVEADVPDVKQHLRRPVSAANDFLLPGNETSVPIDTIDNHIGLDVLLNGKGPFHVWFDTGGYNIIDPAVAREIGAKSLENPARRGLHIPEEWARSARIETMSIGKATLTAQYFQIRDLGPRTFRVKPKQKF